MPCPQAPFGSWKFDFLIFQALCSWCRARRGLLGAGKLTFCIFQALCSRCRARRGLFGAGKLTFSIFQALGSGCRARRGLFGAENLTFWTFQTIFKPFADNLKVNCRHSCGYVFVICGIVCLSFVDTLWIIPRQRNYWFGVFIFGSGGNWANLRKKKCRN